MVHATPPPLRWPLLKHDWNHTFDYVDLDPSPGVLDWSCAGVTYDTHIGNDMTIRDFVEIAHPIDAKELGRRLQGGLPGGWQQAIPTFTAENGSVATRASSGTVLNAIAAKVPELIGGSADLSGSNLTVIKDSPTYSAKNHAGRNIHFGVREHAMASAMNGMALQGGVIPYGGTFLIFSDYMRPAIRLAALGERVIYVFTHDSIGLGEDGPTHQPVEHLTALRVIPGVTVIRPGDSSEVAEAWRSALLHKGGPVALVLTRQKVPFIDRAHRGPASRIHTRCWREAIGA